MRHFACRHCQQPAFFENTQCVSCGHALGFDCDQATLLTLLRAEDGVLMTVDDHSQRWRECGNRDAIGCNWLIAADRPDVFCRACALNRTIPNLDNPVNQSRWWQLEWAKRRLIYGLLRLGLPVVDKQQDPAGGLAFDFLEDAPPGVGGDKVFTGHAGGVITINIVEADDVEREQQRKQLAEPYRTLLGHFRHESGHYYWQRLIAGSPLLEEFRTLFGDERVDYGTAMQRYYTDGAPPDWQARFVSAYASAHAWEDWAETWAHYLHMVDALETAHSAGLRLGHDAGREHAPVTDDRPYQGADFAELMRDWVPLTIAINSLNRSIGHGDFYPFVLPPPTQHKLAFVHGVIRQQGAMSAGAGGG